MLRALAAPSGRGDVPFDSTYAVACVATQPTVLVMHLHCFMELGPARGVRRGGGALRCVSGTPATPSTSYRPAASRPYADTVPGLAQFVDRDGRVVDFQRGADEAWFAQHSFRWVEAMLAQLLAAHSTLYLFGIADNMFELLGHFDQVYHLHADHALLLRLTHPGRRNWMGETEAQRQFILR
jgi:hypothetical protein